MMIKNQTLRNAAFGILTVAVFGSCEKDFDSPPARTLPEGSVMTVQQLRDLYNGQPVHFTEDRSVYAVVTADEENGNLYKSVFVQDHTAAINIRMPYSGGLYQGDSIRIYLPGTILSSYNGMLQLDSVDVDNNVVKQATNVHMEPLLVTIDQIVPSLQAKLIRLENVEFNDSEIGYTYSDPINQWTVNRNLQDCDDNMVIVRTSGYANFAGQDLPMGNGSFVAVVSQFQNDMQLYIRDVTEVQLNGARCDSLPPIVCPPAMSVSEDFASVQDNVDIDLDCWSNVPVVGTRYWRGDFFNTEKYAQATAYQSTNSSDVTWLVSPPVTYTSGMTLSFETQRAFGDAGHDPFALFISIDFNGVNVLGASWDPITSAYADAGTADFVWVPSGSIDLSGYLPQGYTGSFVIGFRYTGSGTSNQDTNFRLDNVIIQ